MDEVFVCVFFMSFQKWTENQRYFSSKINRQKCHNCLPRVQAGFLISPFLVFLAKLTTLHSTSPRDQFEDIKPFWQTFVCFIYHLRTLTKKVKVFSRKQSAVLSKLLTTCPGWFFEEFFFGKVLFLFIIGLSASFFVFCTNFCRSGRQYCFLFVNCTSLWWNSLCQNIFSPIIFGYWSQVYQSLLKFFSTKLTTLHSTSPRVNLGTKNRFVKTLFVSFIICVPWPRKSRLFSENSQQFCQNC